MKGRVSEATLYTLQQFDNLPVTADQICKATRNNPLLSKVKWYTLIGWPKTYEQALTPYYQCRDELSIECECLLWGSRVVIPLKLQSYVLDKLHMSHPGIVRMKTLARKYIWWPNLNKELEELRTALHVKLTDENQNLLRYILGVGLPEHGNESIILLISLGLS